MKPLSAACGSAQGAAAMNRVVPAGVGFLDGVLGRVSKHNGFKQRIVARFTSKARGCADAGAGCTRRESKSRTSSPPHSVRRHSRPSNLQTPFYQRAFILQFCTFVSKLEARNSRGCTGCREVSSAPPRRRGQRRR